MESETPSASADRRAPAGIQAVGCVSSPSQNSAPAATTSTLRFSEWSPAPRRPRRRYDRPGQRPPRRAPASRSPWHPEQRHVHRGELGGAGLLGPARRIQQEGQREDAVRTCPAAVRQATQAPALRPPSTSGPRVGRRRGAGRARPARPRPAAAVRRDLPAGDPPRLLDPHHAPARPGHLVRDRDQVDGLHPHPGTVAEDQRARTAPSASVVCVRAGPSGVSCSSMRVMYPTAGPGVRRPRRSGQVP